MARPAGSDAWRPSAEGLVLRVRLTPRAGRDAVDGLEDTAEGPALKARVRAIPENGEANAALEKLLAQWLGVAKSTVAVTAGGKSRIKTVTVSGDATRISAMLQQKLAQTTD
jgi:uncharacterized protein YggU (UPF0235/DUF167 family)